MMKEDWTPIDFGQTEDTTKNIIKVIGVGGGGCNAVKNMYAEGIVNVSFAVCNTDSQSLSKSPVPVKIMLGKSGLGAGANPEVGRSEAQNTQEDIKKLLDDGTKMVFVTAGMGGGTGTGAAPVIAGIAKGMGILTVGIITIPFYFEKRKKIVKALQGVEEMRKNVDALLIVNNERLCDVYADSEITVKDAFKLADKVLSDATKSISELITVEGTINLDFRDIETTIKSGGGAIMAMGRASGEGRVQSAIKNALDSPLLYGSDISNAQRILFNIYTSSKHPIFVREMREIDAFFDELNPDIKVIWGLSDDDIDKLYHPIRDNFQTLANKTEQKQEAESIDNINPDATEKEATIAHQEEESGIESGEEPAKVWVEDNPPTAENSREVLAEPPVNKPKAWTLGGRIKNGLKKIAEDLDIIINDDENYK